MFMAAVLFGFWIPPLLHARDARRRAAEMAAQWIAKQVDTVEADLLADPLDEEFRELEQQVRFREGAKVCAEQGHQQVSYKGRRQCVRCGVVAEKPLLPVSNVTFTMCRSRDASYSFPDRCVHHLAYASAPPGVNFCVKCKVKIDAASQID